MPHLHNFLAIVLKILWRKFEHPKVARNFALLAGSALWRQHIPQFSLEIQTIASLGFAFGRRELCCAELK